MTNTDTSALIETFKANNEELLKQVALLTEQVEYLTRKLYGKSSEKNVVNTNQLSLFDEDKAGGEDDEDLPSHYRNYYLYANFPEQSNSSPLRKCPKPAKILYF